MCTCTSAADARCTTTASGGEASHGLYFTTAFGKVLPAGPDTIDPNQPIFWLTSASQVPEPASLSLAAIAGIALMRRAR